MTSIDVLGLGCTAVDDFLYLDHFPEPDTKIPVAGRLRQCGGLTATALVAASRLGARCAYAGLLGPDPDSDFVRQALTREGIDLTHARPDADARPYLATIMVDRATASRTIFFERPTVIGPSLDWPPPELIATARVLFVDPMGIAGQLRAARLAREAGVPVVADLERVSDDIRELLELVDHPILPFETASAITGADTPAAAVDALWRPHRRTVVVTAGPEGAWYRDQTDPGATRHQPAFPVEVVDTTGCGDVFHGAYAAALAAGLPAADRVRQAAAAAALKATQPGGQTGCPDAHALAAFLRARA